MQQKWTSKNRWQEVERMDESEIFPNRRVLVSIIYLFLDFSAENGNEDVPIRDYFGLSHSLHLLLAVFQNLFLLRRITNPIVKVGIVLPL